jgi:hypothetical protein
MQINTISHMLLTQGLLDILHKSNGRVIHVASRSYQNWRKGEDYYTHLDPKTYDFEKTNYQCYAQYAYSKMGNIYFNQILAQYINKNELNVKTVSLHPGTVLTEITRNWNGLFWGCLKLLIYPFMWFITKSPLMGCQTTLHLCYINDSDLKNGEYYRDCDIGYLYPSAVSKKMMNEFMRFYRELVGINGEEDNLSLDIF